MSQNKLKYRDIWHEELCFMIMPFATKYNEVYDIIQRAAQKSEVKIVRADSKDMPFPISVPFVEKIQKLIRKSYYIIADISELNANVLYELGLSHALLPQEDVLLIMNDTTECPSDLYHINYVRYNSTQLSHLYDRVVEFLGGGAYRQDLLNYLERYDLISENANKSFIFKGLKKVMKELLAVFNNVDLIKNDGANKLIITLFEKCRIVEDNNDCRDCYKKILIFSIGKLISIKNLDSSINHIFESGFQIENEYNELIADIAIEIIKTKDYEIVLQWIKDLLSQIPTTSVNAAKYAVMLGLLKNDRINNILINWINNNEYKDIAKKQLFLEEVLELCMAKKFSTKDKGFAMAETIMLCKSFNNNYVFNYNYVFNAALKLVVHLCNDTSLKEKRKEVYDIIYNNIGEKIDDLPEFIRYRLKELKGDCK